jgi:hypothetical protein
MRKEEGIGDERGPPSRLEVDVGGEPSRGHGGGVRSNKEKERGETRESTF